MAFIVEDGTGLEDSNAYCTVAFYKDYHSTIGSDDYDPLDDTLIQKYIINATQYIDSEYIDRFKGYKASGDQALQFPRIGLCDNDGYWVDSDSIPVKLKQACCEFALLYKTQGFIFQDLDKDSYIEEVKLDVMEVVYSEDALKQPSKLVKKYTKADGLLKPYINGGYGVIRGVRG